ncbi:MAG: radical SAM family heme chaperone HemW [Clostridiaceae bacterium]
MDKGLYIHIPFCKSKCLYCDFCSYSGKENLMMDYSKALGKEIRSIGDCGIKTIFIGGGTPTYLSLDGWEILGGSLKGLKLAEGAEFTVEANPGTFDKNMLGFLKSLGVNRLSIGLQAVQDSHLKNLGRIHTWEEFLKSYKIAREMGFNNINVDLMFGLPKQTTYEWKESLEAVADLEPEHISCYSLIIEEGTEFFRRYEEGQLQLPEEDAEREMYRYTLDFLKARGYGQYEISNFSKPGRECRHNLIYWDLEEYIGCGAAAHSYSEGKRWSNCTSIGDYIAFIDGMENGCREIHANSEKDDMEEFMFMGLRKINGISFNDFKARFGRDAHEIYGNVINKYLESNLLRIENGRLMLTGKGIELSNSVMCEFIL